ncbi:MAG: GNAT family N-acetyltransferase [Lachnospiraceae bacterium]|nr:GNAT family N-acetyltransferase [Lachnospiraceae bacterium]
MQVRRANIEDSDRIIELLVQVNNVHSEKRPDLFIKDKTKYNKDELAEIIKDDNKPIFVAVDDSDRVMGYMFGKFESHIEDNNYPDIITFYIDDLCVDEVARGQHIGRLLYDYTIDFARAKGCYNVTLNVWAGNDNAIRFYEKCGLKTQKTGLELIL